ncbi:MAG TPA: hypothetical protein VFV72_15875 [Candidatus Limnocylindrales bacterium]|nr:hypothetical protein [Candidatus Limnocylindrales bacterium]
MTRRSRAALGVLLTIATILVLFGIGDIASGPDADPAITLGIAGRTADKIRASEPTGFRLYNFVTRASGLNLVLIGALFLSILAVPYRAGDRWAWSTMWSLPAWALAVPILVVAFGPAPGTMLPPPAISGPILALVAALALFVDRPRFSGRRATQPPAELTAARAS